MVVEIDHVLIHNFAPFSTPPYKHWIRNFEIYSERLHRHSVRVFYPKMLSSFDNLGCSRLQIPPPLPSRLE